MDARQRREPIVVTLHGKPYALIQPISERDLDMLDWKRLAEKRLRDAWAGEDDALYDEVPFSDLSGTKRRPALVVSAGKFHRTLPDLIVCPISSQARFFRTPGPGDRPLGDWRTPGLLRPSTARISKLLAVDKQIVAKALGVLSARDLVAVQAGIREAFGFRETAPAPARRQRPGRTV